MIYRFVFEWRAEYYGTDAKYFFREMLEALTKYDETLMKEVAGKVVVNAVSGYPDEYGTFESKSNLAEKIAGFFSDFIITGEELERKFQEILKILIEFLDKNRTILPEMDKAFGDKFLLNSLSALDGLLSKFYEKIRLETCQNQLNFLLVNILHFMSIKRYEREIGELSAKSVILLMKVQGQLMDFFSSIEAGTSNSSKLDLSLYLEGIFRTDCVNILEGRENKCRILRICATVSEELYDDFWGEAEKSYFVLNIVLQMTEMIERDLLEINDWLEEEVCDLRKCIEICYKLAKKAKIDYHFTRPVSNILRFCMKQEGCAFESFEEEVFCFVGDGRCTAKVRSLHILVLCDVYSSAEVLQRLPNVISLVRDDFKSTKICDLSCHGEFCSHPNSCLKALVELSKTTFDPKHQYELFLKHLLFECQTSPYDGWFRKQVKGLLKKLVSSRSDIALHLIEDSEKIPTEVILFTMNCQKKYPENLTKHPGFRELLIKAMLAFDEDTRIAAAKVFQEISGCLENLNVILDLLKFGVAFQQKSTENKINWIGLLNPLMGKKKRNEEEKMIIKGFIENFRETLFDHYYSRGSFPRQRYALKILKDTWNIYCSDFWEVRHVDSVFSCFDSPYEYVKKLVVECIKKFPKKILIEWTERNFGSSEEIRIKLQNLMTSVKPEESLQAAYQLVIFAYVAPEIFYDPANGEASSKSEDILGVLEWCIEILRIGTENAKQSILKASATNPLYGTILCIRYLLDDIPKGTYKKIPQFSIKETPRWRSFFEKVLTLCSEASQIVAPIVNNSSPEGFLPEDSTMFEGNEDQVTSQMVLLCGWRTIKEVSLLLGEICEKTPQLSNLISEEEVLQIGENFTKILLESKHRGAFEVSSVAFSKLCTRLHLSQCPTIHKLPKAWLEELLAAVLCPDERNCSKYVKLCVTRRSAGLPFIIQSIITSYDPSLLNYAIMRLLKESQKNTDGRIHCLNILRYIFRCSSLKTFKYAGDGLLIAIESFGSSYWAERNSATLLFSALIVRIFGVCRAKGAAEEIPFENTWIFNEFFRDYPLLYDFIYRQLKEANDQLSQGQNAPQLYPIFLVLERLPSLNGHWAPQLDPMEYIAEIERIPAKCHDLRIRILAVKAIITITHPNEYLNRLQWLLNAEASTNSNEFHSKILQIKEIFRRFAKKDLSVIHRSLDALVQLHRIHSNDCLIIGKLFMEILIKYLPKANSAILSDVLTDKSQRYLKDYLNRLEKILSHRETPIGRTAVQTSKLLLHLTLAEDCEETGSILIKCLKELEQQKVGIQDATFISVFNVILLMNGTEKHKIPEEILSEISDVEKDFVLSFKEEQKQIIKHKIASSGRHVIEQHLLSTNPLVKNRALLSMPIVEENTKEFTLQELNRALADDQISEEEKILAIQKASFVISSFEDIFNLNVEALLEFCGSEKNDFTRMNVALLVCEILKMCRKNCKFVREFYVMITRVIMQLLRDDDADVRKVICRAIWLYNKNIRMESSRKFVNIADEVNIPCDSYALNIYMKIILEFNIPKDDAKAFLKTLLDLEESDAACENDESAESEWKVFDTREANLFSDRGFTIKTIKWFLENLNKHNL